MVSAAALSEYLVDRAGWLFASGAPDEALAVAATRRRVLGIGGGTVLKPAGRVWRLGVVLLDRDGRLFATGSVTRAAEQRQHGYTSVSAAERSAVRALAADAFAPGEVVNYDAELLTLDAGRRNSFGPLRISDDGDVLVEWARGGGLVDFEKYLAERATLLVGGAGPS